MNQAAGRPSWQRTLAVRFLGLIVLVLAAFELLRRLLVPLAPQGLPGSLLSAAAALVLVLVPAYLVTRQLTRRLVLLSRSVEELRGEDLPQRFDDTGADESSRIAAGMNLLLERVEEQSKALALRDIRRTEWIAQVSHDLRTPLTAQAACLERVERILHNPDAPLRREELRELLSVAKMDGGRVHALADDLLEIARLEAGDRLNIEPVPPGELVHQALLELQPLAEQRGIRLEIKVTSHLPVLRADGRRLMRAIENLVRNAIQHAKSAVEVTAARSGDQVRFEVRDDGPGLPKEPDFLSYLRRRGQDVRLAELSGRGSRPDSAGLGLVVAQRVAEAHGGSIDAYNVSHGGAAFILAVPLED